VGPRWSNNQMDWLAGTYEGRRGRRGGRDDLWSHGQVWSASPGLAIPVRGPCHAVRMEPSDDEGANTRG
jgi:hypothetical protein